MIETNQFKKGLCFVYKGDPVIITAVTTSTPTARGSNTIAKTRMKNLETGQVLHASIRSGERFEEVDMSHHPVTYLYSDGTRWHFMDDETYEQFDFGVDDLGDDRLYLVDGLEGMRAMLIDERVVGITLPMTVVLTVTETDPAIKGATATAQLKPASTETGLVIQVPPYLTMGERIRVDTRNGHFVERVRD
jgi:elongation factor P